MVPYPAFLFIKIEFEYAIVPVISLLVQDVVLGVIVILTLIIEKALECVIYVLFSLSIALIHK